MLCRNFEASSESAGSIANLLSTMIEQYNALIHEMSMKFGISVSKLKEKMELASPIRTVVTPAGGSAPRLVSNFLLLLPMVLEKITSFSYGKVSEKKEQQTSPIKYERDGNI